MAYQKEWQSDVDGGISSVNILVATLGLTTAVVPEILGLLNLQSVSVYRHHPDLGEIEHLRNQWTLEPAQEVWLCSTDQKCLDQDLKELRHWRDRWLPDIRLRLWVLDRCADIDSAEDARAMREMIHRLVFLAARAKGRGRLYLSLAGGRKTMATDMQSAASWFGADALLHVLASGAPPDLNFSDLAEPLAEEVIRCIQPIVTGSERPSQLLDLHDDDTKAIVVNDYPLPDCPVDQAVRWSPDGRWLLDTLVKRRQDSTQLYGNYLHSLVESDPQGNWRSLYRLPSAIIDRLREHRVSGEDETRLQCLPKADLHRHIGGCLSIDDQIAVAEAIIDAESQTRIEDALGAVRKLIEQHQWPWNWPEIVREGADKSTRALRSALLLTCSDKAQLQYNLYDRTEPRFGLSGKGFDHYERPGELSGSALLGHPSALEPYLDTVFKNARHEGLAYLELRGSPRKYRDTLEDCRQLLRDIHRISRSCEDDLMVRFLLIIDRRQTSESSVSETVQLALEMHTELDGFIAGLDIAGDESADTDESLKLLSQALEPAWRACLPITIHAGEGQPAEKIWEAAYRLHADRIGHGLTLKDQPELLDRFRDRKITLEMCPSSNREVVGFKPGEYPFDSYFHRGLEVAVCTDNPAISRTNAPRELIEANHLAQAGLSLWEALAVIKNGFRGAFLPAAEKQRLLQKIDREIYKLILKDEELST